MTVTISGSLSINSVRAFLAEAESLLDATSPSTLTVDVTDLKSVDSAGALALLELEERARKGSLPLAMTGMNHEVRSVMDLIDRKTLSLPPIHPEKTVSSFFEGVGEGCVDLYRDFVAVWSSWEI